REGSLLRQSARSKLDGGEIEFREVQWLWKAVLRAADRPRLHLLKLRLAVDLEGNGDRHAFKQQADLDAGGVCQRVQAIVTARNDCRRREHAAFRQAGNLVLEVAGH